MIVRCAVFFFFLVYLMTWNYQRRMWCIWFVLLGSKCCFKEIGKTTNARINFCQYAKNDPSHGLRAKIDFKYRYYPRTRGLAHVYYTQITLYTPMRTMNRIYRAILWPWPVTIIMINLWPSLLHVNCKLE